MGTRLLETKQLLFTPLRTLSILQRRAIAENSSGMHWHPQHM